MLQATSFPQVPSMPLPTPAPVAVKPQISFTRTANYTRAGLSVLFVLMLIVALHPGLRAGAKHLVAHDSRVVISTVHGNLVGNGVDLTVAKVRAHDSLFLEIYTPKADGGQRLMERIELPDHKNGYFTFNGEATDLAIDDIDGDGKLEILVPTFDQNMVGHLNIYRYDEGSGAFARSEK